MMKVLKVYWHYAKGIKKYAYGTIVFIFLALLCQGILRPYAFKEVVDSFSKETTHNQVWYLVFIFFAVHIASEIFFRIGEYLICVFEARHMKILRNEALSQLIKHSLSFFSRTFTGSLVTKQKRFVHSAEVLFDIIIDQYINVAVQIIGVITVMCFISLPIAFVLFVLTTLYLGYIVLFSSKRISLDTESARHDSRVTGIFADITGNISIVKMFGTRKREEKRFENATIKHYRAVFTSWSFSLRQNIIQGVFSTVIHIGAISMGIYMWTMGKITPGGLVLTTMYAGQLSACLWGFGRSIKRFSQAIADAKEMIEIMEETPEILDAPGAIENPSLEKGQSSVTFQNVTFGYTKDIDVFKNFSLHIPAGQKVAVIGQSGAGKTTLVQMLLRNVDIQSGAIDIGHYNIAKDVTQDGLKLLISCVSQNVDMFNRKIRDNIGYGKEGVTEEEIIDASKKAQIHNFIETLEKQYNTYVGERGVKLSGGQRQRVSIARALVHDAPILILDEATSSLDNVTEKDIQSILENGLKDKTVIVIAHRLSTIRNCDRIIVLENGKIIQDGNHETLVKNTSGIYYKMLNSHEVAVEMQVQESVPMEQKN